MQDNVTRKRKAAAFAFALIVFIALTIIYFLYAPEKAEPYKIKENSKGLPTVTLPNADDEIKYIGQGFTVTEYTESTARGENALIKVTANEACTVDISVYYPSGKSQSDVFCKQTLNSGESAIWEWKIPTNTSAENLRIVLRSESSYATLNIHVT